MRGCLERSRTKRASGSQIAPFPVKPTIHPECFFGTSEAYCGQAIRTK